MNTSEVLDKAADLVQEQGWWQSPNGWPRAARQPAGLCLEGGIMAALGVTFDSDPSLEEFTACPAYRAVQSYLGLSHELDEDGQAVEPLWRWNDDLTRKAAEVIEVLRAAAMVERTREAVEQRVAVSA